VNPSIKLAENPVQPPVSGGGVRGTEYVGATGTEDDWRDPAGTEVM